MFCGNYISPFLKSVAWQRTNYPAAVVISDNGSGDGTPIIAEQLGANVSLVLTKGIGPARQNGLEIVRAKCGIDSQRVIIVQTDCDSLLANQNYLESIGQAFERNGSIMASVGPTKYPLIKADGNSIIVQRGADFRNCFGSLSLKELFSECGRDINDYLLKPPFRFLAGANTAYRLSVFNDYSRVYPADKSWESIVFSVRLQQIIGSGQIVYLDGQEVLTSNRSYADQRGITDTDTLEKIRLRKYIVPHKSPDSISPGKTLKNLILEIDRRVYSLADDEIIIAAGGEQLSSTIIHSGQRLVQAIHAATGETLPGKFVLIGKIHANR